tara:strand:- start:2654 stop:3415 length:762 start_codon:yes stop_codon:yes gene_type:complete
MAGIHGKNAELRISTSETVLSGVLMGDGLGGDDPVAGTQNFQVIAANRDWKYDRARTYIQASASLTLGEQGHIDLVNSVAVADQIDIDTQTRLINYAGGAINLGPHPTVASGVYAQAVSMELSTVATLVGDARSFTLGVATDTVDVTTIGESWKSFADGLSGFEGSLDGLYLDEFWYKQAIATLSGVIPQRVLKFIPNPATATTYFQGTVIFPEWEISGGFDSAIEHTVPFQGRGPLDAIILGQAFFNYAEVF